MTDEVIRIAVGLRLGSVLCAPHVCHCGAAVDARAPMGYRASRVQAVK